MCHNFHPLNFQRSQWIKDFGIVFAHFSSKHVILHLKSLYHWELHYFPHLTSTMALKRALLWDNRIFSATKSPKLRMATSQNFQRSQWIKDFSIFFDNFRDLKIYKTPCCIGIIWFSPQQNHQNVVWRHPKKFQTSQWIKDFSTFFQQFPQSQNVQKSLLYWDNWRFDAKNAVATCTFVLSIRVYDTLFSR